MTFDECQWVLDRFPITLEVVRARAELGGLGLAIRENNRRSQLLVSRALAKHVPIAPSVALDAARALAAEVVALGPLEGHTLVLGLAETATGLAELVASELGTVDFIHSTRLFSPSSGGSSFAEAHSHAPAHQLSPIAPHFLSGRNTVVVVDDELTTASTVVNLLDAVMHYSSVARVVVACLIDARVTILDGPLAQFARGHQAVVQVCSLATVSIEVGPDAAQIAGDLVRRRPAGEPVGLVVGGSSVLELPKPPNSPRYGVSQSELTERAGFAQLIGASILTRFGSRMQGGAIHVVGIEEQIALPVLVAQELELSGLTVTVNSTTRSPAVVVDDPGYPLHNQIRFGNGAATRRLYNVPRGTDWTIVVPDEDGIVPPTLLAKVPGERLALSWLDRF